jgi:hypothetical protein
MSGPGIPAIPRAGEQYLAQIEARLPGFMAELRSGLSDAVDAYVAAGYPCAEAVAAGIREFGDPATVADGFQAEAAASQARGTALMLLVTGPLVGTLWIITVLGTRLPWPQLVPVGVAVMVTAYGAFVAIAATGQLTRWLPDEPRRAPMAAAIAGFGAIGADALSLVLILAISAAASPVLVAAAAMASLARLTFAAHGTRRCLAMRAALVAGSAAARLSQAPSCGTGSPGSRLPPPAARRPGRRRPPGKNRAECVLTPGPTTGRLAAKTAVDQLPVSGTSARARP